MRSVARAWPIGAAPACPMLTGRPGPPGPPMRAVPAVGSVTERGESLHPHTSEPLGLRSDLQTSAERTATLTGWLPTTTTHDARRLGHKPPAARLAELEQPPKELQLDEA